MGLAGGIVRKVFSKSPCSSAGTGSRGHSEKGSAADHRRRWTSLRLYLCGEEMNAAAEDDDDDGETLSVKSFETCCVMPPEEARVAPTVAHRPMSDAPDDAVDNPGEPDEDQDRVPADEQSHGHVIVPVREEEGAATMIQSAFRGFMARRQLQELRTRQEQEETDGAQDQEAIRSPTAASVATSVLVQVGEESLSNLRLMSAEDSASVQQQQRSSQQRSSSRPPPAPPAFRVKEEWDDSTVSSNVSRMRIQSRIEATTRRERALAYAFSQQLRSCGTGGGSKKRSSARAEQQGGEFNVGWSWLERWMATRQAEHSPAAAADDCMSRNAETGSAAGHHRRVVVVRRRNNDLAGEEKESCGSNDVVSVVSFDGSSSLGGGGTGARSGLSSCHKPTGGSKSRLKGGGRSLPRRKQVAASEHRFQARSHKVSKKEHQRVEQEPHRDRLDAGGFVDDAYQPPTDY